jgi:hypothetical protein
MGLRLGAGSELLLEHSKEIGSWEKEMGLGLDAGLELWWVEEISSGAGSVAESDASMGVSC